MGMVFLAEHRALGRRFAVKLLRPELGSTGEYFERLRREARAASQIRHPGIVDVTDFGTTPGGRAFVVMEYLQGENLAERLQSQGSMAPDEALELMLSVCDALVAAHDHGVIHRDIKPDNIFLAQGVEGPVVKLLDFGLALSPEFIRTRMTEAGYVYGTPGYMSPEQVEGQRLSVASDIYSMGVVLFELLTGVVPFHDDDQAADLFVKVRQGPPSLRDSAPQKEFHPALVEAVERCLAPDPRDRFRSMRELAEALSMAADASSAASPPADMAISLSPLAPTGTALPVVGHTVGGAGRRVRLSWLFGAVAALALPIAVFAWVWWPSSSVPALGQAPALTGSVDRAQPDPAGTIPAAALPPAEEPSALTPGNDRDGGTDGAALPVAEEQEGEGPRRVSSRQGEARAAKTASAARRAQATVLVREGQQALQGRRLEAAAELFGQAVKLHPGQARAWKGLGQVAFEQGRHGEAVRLLGRAVALRPNDTAARLVLGSAHFRLGQRDQAVTQWRRVLALDPSNRAAQRSLDAATGRGR
jgi:Tfp pilus assembly protein PilF